jgi:hypothetical protein
MSSNQHRQGNRTLRDRIDKLIKKIPVGTKILTDAITSELQKTNKRYAVDTTRIGSLLRERTDLKWVKCGVWLKV